MHSYVTLAAASVLFSFGFRGESKEVPKMGNKIIDGRKMPFAMVGQRLIRDTSLSEHAKVTYLVLCSFAEKGKDKCFPSFKTLSEYTGIRSRTTLIAAIKELTDAGYVHKKARKVRGKQERDSNLYTLTGLDMVEGCPGDGQRCPGDEQRCPGNEQQVVQEMDSNNNQLNYNQYINRQIKKAKKNARPSSTDKFDGFTL